MSEFMFRALRSAMFVLIVIGVLSGTEARAQKDAPREGTHQFTFRVEIAGVEAGFFRSVSGLGIETEVVEFREGGSEAVHKLPGRVKYPNIVLKRGFSGDATLYDWYKSVTSQNPAKVNGRIVMFDSQGTRVAQWQFFNGFPVKWEGPEFDASKNEVAIETIEIAHEGLVMTTPGQP